MALQHPRLRHAVREAETLRQVEVEEEGMQVAIAEIEAEAAID